MRSRIRRSSKRSRIGKMNETRGNLDRFGGRGLCRQTPPAVILQDDNFDATNSITICAFTTDPTDAPLFRLSVEPNERNGLRATCRLMVDNISTVAKSRLGSLPPSTAVGFSSSLGR
jgi:hypothetical protein